MATPRRAHLVVEVAPDARNARTVVVGAPMIVKAEDDTHGSVEREGECRAPALNRLTNHGAPIEREIVVEMLFYNTEIRLVEVVVPLQNWIFTMFHS